MQDRSFKNPLREGLRRERAAEPCIAVIFGASGDLTRRKLIPALYNLHVERLLPAAFAIVGVGRRAQTDAEFAEQMRAAVAEHSRRPLDETLWGELAGGMFWIEAESDYRTLARRLAEVDRERGTGGNRLYYLATPPAAYSGILSELGRAGLNRAAPGGHWARVVIEKPVGHDLASARALNEQANAVFDERDVYRIDHYLGKETVQNLLVFRFANAIFEPLWNQKYIDHVQFTVAETIGVGERGEYYDRTGALRDMVQNHMFQLVCLIAMEPPGSLRADAIREEKVKVLESFRPVAPERVHEESVRGQYGPGVIGGKRVPGYRQEPNVASDTRTETYVALQLAIDNWRWAGVPFYLRAGKRMAKRVTEIAFQFRDVPHRLFDAELGSNTLALRIQPDEGITLRFNAKVPGPRPQIQAVHMDFRYGSSFGQEPPEAYERLLLDAILGDSTLFIRRDEVEASWAYVDRFTEEWGRKSLPIPEYPAGSWGPEEADELLARSGRAWRRL